MGGIASITSIYLDRERKENHVQRVVPRSTSFHIGVKMPVTEDLLLKWSVGQLRSFRRFITLSKNFVVDSTDVNNLLSNNHFKMPRNRECFSFDCQSNYDSRITYPRFYSQFQLLWHIFVTRFVTTINSINSSFHSSSRRLSRSDTQTLSLQWWTSLFVQQRKYKKKEKKKAQSRLRKI